MRQNYPENMLDDAPSQPPSKRVKASSSSRRPNKDTSQAASSASLALDVSKCQSEEQAMITAQSWPMETVETIMRLGTPVTMDGLSLGTSRNQEIGARFRFQGAGKE